MHAYPWLSCALGRPCLLFTSAHGRGLLVRLGPCSASANRQSRQSSGVRGLNVHFRFGFAHHACHQRFSSRFRRCQITSPNNPMSNILSAMRASFCTDHLSVVGFALLTLPALRGSGSFFLPPAPILNFPASTYARPALDYSPSINRAIGIAADYAAALPHQTSVQPTFRTSGTHFSN